MFTVTDYFYLHIKRKIKKLYTIDLHYKYPHCLGSTVPIQTMCLYGNRLQTNPVESCPVAIFLSVLWSWLTRQMYASTKYEQVEQSMRLQDSRIRIQNNLFVVCYHGDAYSTFIQCLEMKFSVCGGKAPGACSRCSHMSPNGL